MSRHVGIVGSRRWTDYAAIFDTIRRLGPDVTIVSGGAPGADECAERAAKELELDIVIFRAKWTRFGNPAGPIRNTKLAEHLRRNRGHCIAFDQGGPGTASVIKACEKLGVPVEVRT